MKKKIESDAKYEFLTVLVYCIIGLFLSYFSHCIRSEFINNFVLDIIPLLATILTVNVASTTILAGKIKEIKDVYPKANFNSTYTNSIAVTATQVILIGIIFFVSICYNSEYLKNNIYITCLFESIGIGAFIYYMHVVIDLFMSILEFFRFVPSKKENDNDQKK